MPSIPIQLRKALYAAIEAARDTYSVSGFELQESQLPSTSLPELQKGVRVTVMGLGGDETRMTRSTTDPLVEIDQPVLVAVQAAVDPKQTAEVDALIDFAQELQATARILSGYRWQRTEVRKDDAGVPYDFMHLREQHEFHAYFTAWYQAFDGG